MDQRLGQPHPLPVTFGKLLYFFMFFRREAYLVNHFLHPFFQNPAREAAQASCKMKVFTYIHFRVQRIVLREVAYT
ncbi:hypothetical protein D9M69_544430 [compost metagenome]